MSSFRRLPCRYRRTRRYHNTYAESQLLNAPPMRTASHPQSSPAEMSSRVVPRYLILRSADATSTSMMRSITLTSISSRRMPTQASGLRPQGSNSRIVSPGPDPAPFRSRCSPRLGWTSDAPPTEALQRLGYCNYIRFNGSGQGPAVSAQLATPCLTFPRGPRAVRFSDARIRPLVVRALAARSRDSGPLAARTRQYTTQQPGKSLHPSVRTPK
ncbi:hypothetical protein OH76DRAFT_1016828 [Lentinus brumalis]|uniref:Uncharacterized protein n=1 Tax=Lentinus brumalis TaxID=2498619 RepID=A0A371CY17_9APHY|nr:hypothetical protein OH76DRAFT_1016828 [Polyporus brumalis]